MHYAFSHVHDYVTALRLLSLSFLNARRWHTMKCRLESQIHGGSLEDASIACSPWMSERKTVQPGHCSPWFAQVHVLLDGVLIFQRSSYARLLSRRECRIIFFIRLTSYRIRGRVDLLSPRRTTLRCQHILCYMRVVT